MNILSKVDGTGRVLIPVKIRESLGIEAYDVLIMSFNDEKRQIIIEKDEKKCFVCGAKDDITELSPHVCLCDTCTQKFADALKRKMEREKNQK